MKLKYQQLQIRICPLAHYKFLCTSTINPEKGDSISDYNENTPTGWEFDD